MALTVLYVSYRHVPPRKAVLVAGTPDTHRLVPLSSGCGVLLLSEYRWHPRYTRGLFCLTSSVSPGFLIFASKVDKFVLGCQNEIRLAGHAGLPSSLAPRIPIT